MPKKIHKNKCVVCGFTWEALHPAKTCPRKDDRQSDCTRQYVSEMLIARARDGKKLGRPVVGKGNGTKKRDYKMSPRQKKQKTARQRAEWTGVAADVAPPKPKPKQKNLLTDAEQTQINLRAARMDTRTINTPLQLSARRMPAISWLVSP